MSAPSSTTSTGLAFQERCRAAEELSTLGYRAESELLWRSALSELTTSSSALPAALKEDLQRLLAEHAAISPDASDWRVWQERARALSAQVSAPPRTLPPTLRQRVAFAAGALVFASTVVTFAVHSARATVTSLADYTPDFASPRAIDGDPQTEWLLPDHRPAFIDISLPTRRAVHGLTLTNGHNAPYLDRAAKSVHVIVFDDDVKVDEKTVTFTEIDKEPSARAVNLKGKVATRVRLDVLEHFGLGGAIAEVEVN